MSSLTFSQMMEQEAALKVQCPFCGAKADQRCSKGLAPLNASHPSRVRRAKEVAAPPKPEVQWTKCDLFCLRCNATGRGKSILSSGRTIVTPPKGWMSVWADTRQGDQFYRFACSVEHAVEYVNAQKEE